MGDDGDGGGEGGVGGEGFGGLLAGGVCCDWCVLVGGLE